MNFPQLASLLVIIAALVPMPSHADDLRGTTTGDYAPASGAGAHWEINDAHTLMWDSKAWIPGGGIFQPRSLADPDAGTDANWNLDVQDLKTLKAHGVTQILLVVGTGPRGTTQPITSIPPDAVQRVLDYLDGNGFTYGIDLNGFPLDSITAVTVNPAIYRQANPAQGVTATIRPIEGLTSARYFLASSRDGSILAHGAAAVQNGTDASVSFESNQVTDRSVLLVYPTRIFDDSSLEGRHCPDIWSNSDSGRDSLTVYLSKLRFGVGLRFFLDPIRDDLGFYGVIGAGFIPDSDSYRLEFESWLRKKYAGRLSEIERSWVFKNEDLPDFATCARAIPLWYQNKGIQSFYDPKSDKLFEADAVHSTAWQDIKQFQSESVQDEMNGIATALKRAVADVPVLYRWSQIGTLSQNMSTTGYDGLYIDTPLHGDDLVEQAAGYAVSDAEHARRPQWLVASLTPPGPAASSKSASSELVGYGSQEKLTSDDLLLAELGVRGTFVDALRRATPAGVTNMLDVPAEQLDWMHSESDNLASQGPTLTAQRSQILYYPDNLSLPGTQIEQLPNGTWWLPASIDSNRLDLGPFIEGYSIPRSGTTPQTFVIFSATGGTQTVKMLFPKKSIIAITDVSGHPIKFDTKKDITTFLVGTVPVEITGVDKLPLPEDASAQETAEVNRLLALGKTEGASMQQWHDRLYYIQNNPLSSIATSPQQNYEMMRTLKDTLAEFVSPFVWIEGESAIAQSFGMVVASPDVSNGAFLWLDNSNPPASAYTAQYRTTINTPGDYDIWASLAPTSPAGFALDASPFTVQVDDGTALTADRSVLSGEPYGSLSHSGSKTVGQFMWARLVTVNLSAGEHTLTFSVTDPAQKSGRWMLGIDAICLSRGDFKPDGPRKPAP